MNPVTKLELTPNMQYCTDPKSGNRLSAIEFGCMRFPKSATNIEQCHAFHGLIVFCPIFGRMEMLTCSSHVFRR